MDGANRQPCISTAKIPPAEINEVLISRLQEHNEILPASAVLLSCKTNERRVSFLYDLLVENRCLPQLSPDGKSNDKSLEYRQKGNEMFKKRKSKEAHEFYTKSVAFAENDHETLSLAYANRSAVLFENGLYEECLRDINQALKFNYPEKLKPKLLARQLKAKELVANQEKVTFFTPIPSIPDPNPLIEAASNSIKIENSPTLGRHIVATKNIEPGEIIAIERPYCQVSIDQLYIHCHHCLDLCYTLIPCPKCTEAMFCSDICQQAADSAYHQYECAILLTIKDMDLMTRLLHLRITILVREQYGNLDKSEVDDGVYKSDRYHEIRNLVANTSKRSAADLFNRAAYAAAFYHLLKTHTNFFEAKSSQFEADFKELLLFHLQIGACNFHEVSEIKSSDNSMEQEEIGAAAYSFLSMFNHSCCPNVVRNSYGSTAVVVALEGIKKGEQCYDNYGYHHALMSKTDRQAKLQKQYFFHCNCEACKNDYPLFDCLQDLGLKEETSISTQDWKYLQDNNLQEAKKIFQKLKGKIAKSQIAKPNKNLAELQESLKHCCFIFRIIKTPL